MANSRDEELAILRLKRMLRICRGGKNRVPISCRSCEKSKACPPRPTNPAPARKKGLSQEEFAGLAGIDRAYYGGIERGERNVAALNLIKLAEALDVEVGKLFPALAALRRAKGGSDGC
jgi:DNA-binding XRE family transcriptional regulator